MWILGYLASINSKQAVLHMGQVSKQTLVVALTSF
jgi:hypothetical protein